METTLAEPVNHQSRSIRSEQLPPSPAVVCGDEHKPKHKFCGGYLETYQQKQVRRNTLSVVCETRTCPPPVLSLLPIAVSKLRYRWTGVRGGKPWTHGLIYLSGHRISESHFWSIPWAHLTHGNVGVPSPRSTPTWYDVYGNWVCFTVKFFLIFILKLGKL